MSQPTKEAKLKWFDRLCDDAFGGLPIQAEGQAIRAAIEETVAWKIRAKEGLKEILELRAEVQRLKKEIRVVEEKRRGK